MINDKSAQGYTLPEALFQLVVFYLLAQLLIVIYFWLDKLNDSYFMNEEIAWEIFVNDFQNYLNNVVTIQVTGYNDKVELEYANSTRKIQIGQSKDIIRKQVDNVGNVPMFIGIQNLKFELHNHELHMTVRFQNGRLKERTFFVQIVTK
nr:competence type IV pilus minor pilin ComGF [Lysinibacillus timonensis]